MKVDVEGDSCGKRFIVVKVSVSFTLTGLLVTGLFVCRKDSESLL